MVQKKIFLKVILTNMLLVCLVLLVGCNKDNEIKTQADKVRGKVSASGSSSMLPLLKAGQEELYEKYANITINLSAGGSFTGQNQVVTGSVDIGNSDVSLQASLENKGLKEHLLVGIPFVFIANKDVPINDLTQEQYTAILTGKITNWQELGGKNQPITIISRSLSSGSRATITEVVLNGERFTDNAIIQDSNGALRSAVETTPGSIGYVDAAYIDESVKILSYNGVKYSVENVAQGKYPVYTYGRMFTRGEPQGIVKLFIDYVTSIEFQDKYAEKNGFIPLNKIKK